jgi:hypothetical protein
MDWERVIEIGKENYIRWKKLAQNEKDLETKLKYYRKTVFWLEILLISKEIEELEKIDEKEAMKAKEALTKKLSDYLNEILKEL